MKSFSFKGETKRYPYEGPSSVLEALRSIQPREYTPKEFNHQIRRRIRYMTGRQNLAFASDEEVVACLVELGVVNFQ